MEAEVFKFDYQTAVGVYIVSSMLCGCFVLAWAAIKSLGLKEEQASPF